MPSTPSTQRSSSNGLAAVVVWLTATLVVLPAGAASPATVPAASAAASTAASTAALPTALPAATSAASALTDRCLDAADEAAMLACRKAAHAEVSRALRQAVDKLQQRLRDDAPEDLKLFNAAQQAWRQYSQAECRFRHRESATGAAYPALLLFCATALSRQRLQALQTVINRP